MTVRVKLFAAAKDRAARKGPWTRKELLAQIKHRRGTAEFRVAERLFAWVDKRGDMYVGEVIRNAGAVKRMAPLKPHAFQKFRRRAG